MEPVRGVPSFNYGNLRCLYLLPFSDFIDNCTDGTGLAADCRHACAADSSRQKEAEKDLQN
jgi:hypothetical protein